MWDPISIFYCMWILNIGLPEAKLNVTETIKTREEAVINNTIINSTTIRGEI